MIIHWDNIADTHWLVYAFCIYLLWIGYRTTKPRLLSINHLVIAAILYFIVITPALFIGYDCTWRLALIWLGTLLGGTILGYIHARFYPIKAVQQSQHLYLPGTWIFFILIIGVQAFILYRILFMTGINVLYEPHTTAPIFGFVGLGLGLLAGKTLWGIKCIKFGPYIVLKTAKNNS